MINLDSTIQPEVVSAAEAAEILGVKRDTLYAYTSRGLLVRVPLGSGRASGYLRSDILRLKTRSDARGGHAAVAAGALRWGEPVLDSSITLIDPRGPAYRGHLATELGRGGRSFEEVAELLFSGALPATRPEWHALPLPKGARALRAMVAGAAPVDKLSLLLPALALEDPLRRDGRSDRTNEVEFARARRIIARLAAGFDRSRSSSVAHAALRSLGASRVGPAGERAVNLALVLIADHELNASCFAARIAGGVKADLYSSLTAALATASAPGHAGECDRVERLLTLARGPARAELLAVSLAGEGQVIPGFYHHPLYPQGDPRAASLLEAARSLSAKRMATLDAMITVLEKRFGLHPTVDVGLVAVARALGMVAGAATAMFVLGRSAGWVAHTLEQREAAFLLRPRARYVGVPLAKPVAVVRAGKPRLPSSGHNRKR